MRDQYIELIKEYVKQKPADEVALEDLKNEVLKVGATEEEFAEAIRQITSLPPSTAQNPASPDQAYVATHPTSKLSKISNAASALKDKKKLISSVALGLILLLILSRFLGQPQKTKNVASTIEGVSPVKEAASKAFPVVYANQITVDSDKVFAIKSANINLTVTGKPKKEVLGFFPYWMLENQDKIALNTLTSVSIFGLDVDGKGNISTAGDKAGAEWAMWQNPLLDKFIQKARGYNLKIYLTIKSFNSDNIDSIAKSDTAQKNFIANALYLVNSKNLDGINIDFEYIGSPSNEVRDGFTRLITNLNAEMKRQLPKSVLTIDTYLVSGSDNGLFNIQALSQNLDAFVIMGYDMHTPLGGPGPVSAMGGDTNIIGYVQNYLEKTSPSKLILAVPYYGYDWPNDVASPAAGLVNILPYAQVADISKNIQLSWDETSQTPFFNYKDGAGQTRVVHFDNVRSLGIKYDFINRKDLRGVGIWALGYDGQNQDLEKLLVDKFINQ